MSYLHLFEVITMNIAAIGEEEAEVILITGTKLTSPTEVMETEVVIETEVAMELEVVMETETVMEIEVVTITKIISTIKGIRITFGKMMGVTDIQILSIYFVNFNDSVINLSPRVTLKLFNRNLNLIVDSGAICSLIDQNYLPSGIRINVGVKIAIRGVNGTTKSLGYIFTSLQYFSYKFFIKLHVVQSLPSHVIGLVGTDLLTKYKANIDFEQLSLTLKQKSDTVHIPLLSGNINTTLTLPARTELVTFVKTNSNEPCVVLNQQLATNVFVASSLAIPTNGEVPIRIHTTIRNSAIPKS